MGPRGSLPRNDAQNSKEFDLPSCVVSFFVDRQVEHTSLATNHRGPRKDLVSNRIHEVSVHTIVFMFFGVRKKY